MACGAYIPIKKKEEFLGAGRDGGFAIADGCAAQPKLFEVFIEPFQFVGCLDARHGDKHFLEGFVVGEGQHGHFAQRDGL